MVSPKDKLKRSQEFIDSLRKQFTTILKNQFFNAEKEIDILRKRLLAPQEKIKRAEDRIKNAKKNLHFTALRSINEQQSKINFNINVPLDKKKDFFKKLYFFKRNLHFTWNLQEINVSSKEGFVTKKYVLKGPKIYQSKITKYINYKFNNFDINLNFDS